MFIPQHILHSYSVHRRRHNSPLARCVYPKSDLSCRAETPRYAVIPPVSTIHTYIRWWLSGDGGSQKIQHLD